ncbi:hypothetical protein [Pedobacter rhizosphaerae]|uniref:Uncharacterized protein n=1 Tax=Pedobacter rhizosphaerae TaxID=390241 RepID=A0A1H9N505_9SPHI|nr:hypothetical protein [Pedobacter rhizosphaerae]SER30847.1 hypothetical protein SAMN04488023_10738 [Pedobacter rhizosphaerae]
MMTWTNFSYLLFLLYLIYYGVNLCCDLLLKAQGKREVKTHQVFLLEDDIAPVSVFLSEQTALTDATAGVSSLPLNPVSTGGVSFAELLALASQDAIALTSQISY